MKVHRNTCLPALFALLAVFAAVGAFAQGLRLENAGGMAGLNFYDDGHWGVVRSVIVNESDREARALLLIWFREAPGVQFGNRVTLPPQSRREVMTLISPHALPPEERRQGAELMVTLVSDDGAERVVDSTIGIVAIRERGMRSAIATSADEDGPRQLHGVLRQAAGLTPTTFGAAPHIAPEDAPAWGGLDVLVLAGNMTYSPAQQRAIRQWVLDGGRLWVMLEQTGPALPEAILGDHWPITWIDRVALTELTIEGQGVSQAVVADYPIEMARVWAEAPAQVTLEAQGYPAAVRWPVGRGQVMVTTIASAAWLDDKGSAREAITTQADLLRFTDQQLRQSGMTNADALVGTTATRMQGLVGHRVLSRATVVIVLAVFLLGLLAVGVFLAGRGRLEWAAPFGVALGVVCAAVLVMVGYTALGRTPGVSAMTPIHRIEPASPTAAAAAMIGVYRQPGATRLTRLVYQGPPPILEPNLTRTGPRLVRNDTDVWSIESIELAPGEVHSFRLAGQVDMPAPVTVVGRFDEQAITLHAHSAEAPHLEDAMLVTMDGRLAATTAEPGVWSVDLDERLGEDQFMRSVVLSQRQMDRVAAYRALLAMPGMVDRPMLVGWSDRAAVSVGQIEGVESRIDGPVLMPIRFEAPPPGRRFRVPAALLPMSPMREMGGLTIYDANRRVWLGTVNNPVTAMMVFEVPKPLRDVQLETVTVSIDLRSPGRTYEILTARNGQTVTLHSARDAAGLTTITLSGDNLPQRRDDGSVIVGLRVGELPQGSDSRSYTLTRMEIELVGSMPDR